MTPRERPGWAAWCWGVLPAFVVLNALLTFENRWPGAGVRFGQRLSYELCVGVLALLAWCAWRGAPRRRALDALAAGVTLLVLLRYADVTTPALLGREPNLWWDARHVWQLLRLAADAAPAWHVGAAAAAALAVVAGVFVASRWALARLALHLAWQRPRPWLWAAGAALTASWAVHPFTPLDTRWFFALPVAPTLAREAVRLPSAWSPALASAQLGDAPPFDRPPAAVAGRDVVIVFAEAYGATAFDDAAHALALAPWRETLARALASSGRAAASARVRSPTFGGSSWLAHAALLAGVDTRRALVHDVLLASDRPTLVRHFAAHGWRTVGWMPGLQRPWPEGAFYGYERLAALRDIGYRGAAFGYWQVPDEAAMALLHAQELSDAARRADPRPRLVVFPTVSSHAPFRPLPPLLDDWDRAVRAGAYTPAQVDAALAPAVSWLQPAGAWLDAMRYQHAWLASYLGRRAGADVVFVVVGDHQPLATVTGADASWDVAVHVIAADRALLARFEAAGFAAGLHPPVSTWGAMHELTALLVHAFAGDAGGVATASGPARDHVP